MSEIILPGSASPDQAAAMSRAARRRQERDERRAQTAFLTAATRGEVIQIVEPLRQAIETHAAALRLFDAVFDFIKEKGLRVDMCAGVGEERAHIVESELRAYVREKLNLNVPAASAEAPIAAERAGSPSPDLPSTDRIGDRSSPDLASGATAT